MRFLSSAVVLFTVVACSGAQAPLQGSGAQGAHAGDGDDGSKQDANAAACTGKPVPAHECVGGVPAPRCNVVAGKPRWQIDCVPPPSNAPHDSRGVSPCEDKQCGAEPAWDADDCVHGFVGDEGICESIDRGACTWRRHCKPKPCSPDEGTCNVLHEERLGQPCSGEMQCPSGSTCGSVSVEIGKGVGPVCITDPPCSAITCAPGAECLILESYPIQVVCSKM